jgi:hypothetical protein
MGLHRIDGAGKREFLDNVLCEFHGKTLPLGRSLVFVSPKRRTRSSNSVATAGNGIT